ncbi:replication/maintenance protein RepL, partial [Campylobacter coli]|nr:replication/maintenance protein RepL [Campylobacter coli]
MKEIVDLENKPVTRLYSKVEEKVDNITGEVTTIVSSFLQKEKTKDDFIKLFVENINYLTDNLSNSALRVVLMMFKNLNYQNIFHYNSDFVSYFTNKKILGKSSVYRAIKELEDKNVIFKITKEQQEEYDIISPNSYIMNPQIIGKGSFKDLKKLRQTTIKEFDFEKLEMIQKVEVESEYEGLDEVKENPENYYIEDIKQIAYPNTIENQIIISKKEAEADNQTLIANDTQPAL